MENATKALLIAAAVLIVIVLVALGIKLLYSTGNSADSAGKVSNSIGQETQDFTTSIQINLADISKMTDLEFNKFIYNNFCYEKVGKISGNQVLKMCELIRKKYGSLREVNNSGSGNSNDRAHISWVNGSVYSYEKIEDTVKNELSANKKYRVCEEQKTEPAWNYFSIKVKVSE